MDTTASVEIDCPIERVFEITNGDVTEWSITVVKEEILHETKEGVETTFRITTEERGKQMEFDGVVTCHEPPTASGIDMVGQFFDITADYTFEDLGGGSTRVTQHSSVHPKGFFKVIFFFVGWLAKKSSCDALDKELNSLKQLCEQRHQEQA
ncbi:MAG: hypothetical protein GY747_03165 [Planctomycetes bacterium]|nr:hypothetical protein [Planctomycetota bacterium]MCP4770856.1 hypothetical protein [Planctomycetota bacterium]MCP4862319.1 hypothetical protein [Planctomycetota bacterium]